MWNGYIEITTKAMVGKPQFPGGVVYVDLFCGPGVCHIRETGDRIPGSPLIAANAPKPFGKILLCELDDDNASACESRLSKMISRDRFEVIRGDCNHRINDIAKSIPSGALTLAFLDPTGLHLNFSTVETLSKCGAVDLLILFPDAVDIMRNEKMYFDQPESNLDKVLGQGSKWKEIRASTTSSEPAELRKLFVNIYQEQLRRLLGYAYSDVITIRGKTGPLYKLVYATKNKLGLNFWVASCKKDLSGQQGLFD